jgi:Bacterial aa3 type cytochrome c oxidase subunit IV
MPAQFRGPYSWEDEDVGVDTSRGHSAMDYTQHNQTYAGFLKITKYTIVFLVLLLAGMKFFLV